MVKQLNTAEIEAGMTNVAKSPKDGGTVEMIVARPDIDERVVLNEGQFSLEEGLVGDNWLARGTRHTENGRAHPDMQITFMNSRYLDLIAGSRDRWPLAGDQLIVDLDLSVNNLAAGQQLQIGETLFEVTAVPHNGCIKFKKRFGLAASRFTGAPSNKPQRLRGIYVKVIQPGVVRVGDTINKV